MSVRIRSPNDPRISLIIQSQNAPSSDFPLSSSAFNLAPMTLYSTFCFLPHLRFSAFSSENDSIRDGLAETFWFYSQNLPCQC